MSRPRTYRTEAIVLHGVRTGEADRILTLFTPGLGKLRAVVRGVLRPTSHLAGHLEPFSRSALMLARSRNLDIITQAETIESFSSLRADLQRAASALCAFELLDRLSEEGSESHQIYVLLHTYLSWQCVAEEPDLPLRYFELRLLSLSGFGPELYECLACRRRVGPETNAFSTEAGGVLCAACIAAGSRGGASDAPGDGAGAPGDRGVMAVSVNALKVMRLFQGGDPAQARRLHAGPALSRELEQLMRCYLPTVTERELRATAFVDNVRTTSRFRSPGGVHGLPSPEGEGVPSGSLSATVQALTQ